MHPQTIQVFLPFGNPQSLRVAWVTTRLVNVIEIPRAQLDRFMRMSEAQAVGLYFLFGEDEQTEHPQVYIGQTERLGERLKEHNRSKDFWNKAVVVVSRAESLNVAHGRFLEAMAIQKTKEVERYILSNGNTGILPQVHPSIKAECVELFGTIDILLTTLGYPLFELKLKRSVAKGQVREDEKLSEVEKLFFCRGDGVEGCGIYTEEGMVVLKGSYGRVESKGLRAYSPSCVAQRERAIKEGILKWEGQKLRLMQDRVFTNPSPAASFLLGRAANGWIEWKDETGHTLSECVRE
ncbi:MULTISPECIES: GIY-YIG nuclease family protein [Bombella]|uniref:GIY-YIG nuclease family protein n=1 Tax=Bombella pollinis TaxID=2967337 RepID=A0ABT3WKV9_9PROT|nr:MULTISPECIES: GIY-YIG nuclease family protein [Bombella]MCX5619621.1 GIY-YIG nuclease family protein [Bombella pollinis]MUG04329.1 DUF4357 domain-containing protein [Bombella sp. ESL0378]